MPDTNPVPIASTYSGLGGTGTITFDRPLDTGITLDPSDWLRGTGGQTRHITSLHYSSSTVITFDTMGVAAAPALANGYKYTPGANPIAGVDGAQVHAFEGFTG